MKTVYGTTANETEALQTEYEYGVDSLVDAAKGASKFVQGAGRHGNLIDKTVSHREGGSPLKATSGSSVHAVLFDLGGVLLESPFRALADYARQCGVDTGTLLKYVSKSGTLNELNRLRSLMPHPKPI